MQTLEDKVIAKIYGRGRGWAFTPKEFASLGDARSVGMALTRLTRKGTIRRLARGLYDYPREDPSLGLLPPSTDDIAKALKGRDDSRLQPSGAHAANLLGLSNQVPVRAVYLTDATSRKVQVGKRQIVLKHTTTRNMATAGRISGTVIQALRWLGERHVNDDTVAILRRQLSEHDKKQLAKDLRYAPAWIAEFMKRVTQS